MSLEIARKSKIMHNHLLYRPQDFFTGSISKNEVEVSKVYGNYLGFIDFDNKRYWDIREQSIHAVVGKDILQSLPSDSRLRIDS